MEKQSKHLLILLLVLVVLAAAVLGLRHYNNTARNEAEEETGEIIADVSKDDVVKLTYDYEGITYTFEKEDDTWYYADDHSVNVTQYQITNMISKVAPLTAEQVIEDVTNMTQYGLADVQRTIGFETEGASYIFEVGDYNSVSGVYYIRKPSENIVYAVDSAVVSIFNKSLEDVTEEEETEEESTEESSGTASEEMTEESSEEISETAEESSKAASEEMTEESSEEFSEAAEENSEVASEE